MQFGSCIAEPQFEDEFLCQRGQGMKHNKAPQLTEQEIKEIPLIEVGFGCWLSQADIERDAARRAQKVEEWLLKRQLRIQKFREWKKWLLDKIPITGS